MPTATLVRSLTGHIRGQDVAVYELTPHMVTGPRWDGDDRPERRYRYVAVSKVDVPFSGPETYIFPASDLAVLDGKRSLDSVVASWNELGGYRGEFSHAEALEFAGYTLA